jgi:hypothetical protein
MTSFVRASVSETVDTAAASGREVLERKIDRPGNAAGTTQVADRVELSLPAGHGAHARLKGG